MTFMSKACLKMYDNAKIPSTVNRNEGSTAISISLRYINVIEKETAIFSYIYSYRVATSSNVKFPDTV